MKMLTRVGVVLLAAVMAVGLVAPVFAGEVETAEIDGTIGKIIKGMDIPAMVKEHHPDVVKILKVDGVGVLVTKGTDIEFKDEDRMKLMVGDEVEVKGEVLAVVADKIEVKDEAESEIKTDGKDVTIEGTIDKVIYPTPMMLMHHPDLVKILVIDGVHVIVTKTTMTEGMLKTGTEVEVEGKLHALIADEIEVED